MNPFRTQAVRALLPVVVLTTLVPPVLGEGEAAVPPIELPMEEPGVELAGGSDDCGCARELTSCLLAATWALNQCLSTARGTVGEAICLGIYEVRVGLCYQEVARCIARCVV